MSCLKNCADTGNEIKMSKEKKEEKNLKKNKENKGKENADKNTKAKQKGNDEHDVKEEKIKDKERNIKDKDDKNKGIKKEENKIEEDKLSNEEKVEKNKLDDKKEESKEKEDKTLDKEKENKIKKEKNIKDEEGKNDFNKRGKGKFEEDFYHDKYNKKYKLYGFSNSRNNCYLNSSLQLLTRINELKEEILNFPDKYINREFITRGNLVKEFKIILEEIENNKKIIDPDYLKKEMGKIDERYKYNSQEDANEFISNFLDGLREETSDKSQIGKINKNIFNDKLMNEAYEKFYNKFYKRKGYSFLLDLFYGNYITKTYCKKCNKKSIKFSAFNMIELPIYQLAKHNEDNSLDIHQILDSYFSESKIHGKTCECGEKEVYSKISIFELPQNLIVFFGRTANGQYINDRIDYDDILNLDDYLYKKDRKRTYSLDCVIEHSGSSDFGHYTSLCKIENSWYYFSDSFYHPENNPDYKSDFAIILLYKS